MDRVELHDVEYGDCTVLVGQNRQILMVDCGSVSRYARRGEKMREHGELQNGIYAALIAREGGEVYAVKVAGILFDLL